MNNELRKFFTALSFYSRLPVPSAVHTADNAKHLPDAIRYLPLVGWIAGIIAAVVFTAANYLFGNSIAVLLSMVSTIWLTGAFHEDGFADVCDGFGGGWTKDKILLIMKDSRLGTYGVVGLVILLAIKFSALQKITSEEITVRLAVLTAGVFVIAHTLSRFAAITVVFTQAYVRIEESKASGAVDKGRAINLYIAGFLTLIPLIAFSWYTSRPLISLIIIPVLLCSFYLGSYFKKWIGGYTGDCLGAVQQLTEVIIYLSILLLWKFT